MSLGPIQHSDEIVALSLNGGRVTQAFRAALFEAAAREGHTVNEYVLRAAGARPERGAFVEGSLMVQGRIEFPEVSK
jgi:hypothetical protein